MNNLIWQGETALWYLLGNPSNRTEAVVLASLCALTLLLVLGRMERATNVPRSGFLMTLAVGCLGGALVLASTVLLRKYVSPALGFPHHYGSVVVAAGLVSCLAVIPLMCILQRASIPAGFATWGVSVCAALCVVVIARTGFDVMEAGSAKADASRARSAEVEQIVDGPVPIEGGTTY